MAIFEQDLDDGRKEFGVMSAGGLSRLIASGTNKGDVIDVWNGTVQLVVNPRASLLGIRKYGVDTLTQDDDGSLKLIRYVVKNGKVIDVSKRDCNVETSKGKIYNDMYRRMVG